MDGQWRVGSEMLRLLKMFGLPSLFRSDGKPTNLKLEDDFERSYDASIALGIRSCVMKSGDD
jgi:hypothetical protein